MKGVTVRLDNASFVLCAPFVIKEKEMASVETLIVYVKFMEAV